MPTLNWIGKERVINHHQTVPYRVMERQFSYDGAGQRTEDNGSENMIIHGDNLDALKALLPSYNTYSEGWVYSDDMNDQKQISEKKMIPARMSG